MVLCIIGQTRLPIRFVAQERCTISCAAVSASIKEFMESTTHQNKRKTTFILDRVLKNSKIAGITPSGLLLLSIPLLRSAAASFLSC